MSEENKFSFSFISAAPSSIVPGLPVTWSPWDPSPLFLQQRHSLTPQASQQLSIQTKISKYLQSLGNVTMTSNHPPHPPPPIPIKSESADYSISERKPQAKATKQKTLNSTYSSRSLTSENDEIIAEQNKYFSNSLNCLNMKEL
jgi:hypothetical protein